MKRLIENNFLYYRKTRTKTIISICFVLSFFVMVFVYDHFESDDILLVNRRREQMSVVDYDKFGYFVFMHPDELIMNSPPTDIK